MLTYKVLILDRLLGYRTMGGVAVDPISTFICELECTI